MEPNLIIVGSDKYYNTLKSSLKDVNITYIKDIYLLSDVLDSKPSIIFGDGLGIDYVESVINIIYSDPLNWHKYIYLDTRDLNVSSFDVKQLIIPYLKMVERNRYLDHVLTIGRLSKKVDRESLLNIKSVDEKAVLMPVLRDASTCEALSNCSLCLDNCPFGAILNNKPPSINVDLCVECGFCLNLCPSLLYLSIDIPLDSTELLLRTFRELGDRNKYLLIIDSLKRLEYYKFYMDIKGSYTVLPLYNPLYFSIYHVVIAVSYGYTPIYYINKNREGYREFSSLIKEFINLTGIDIRFIDSIASIPFGIKYDSLPQYPKSMYFGYEDIMKAISDLLHDNMEDTSITKLPIYGIEINDKCTLCGECVFCCPTGALKIKHSGELVKLMFNQVKCIGCGGCTAICPVDAIKMSRMIDRSLYIKDYTVKISNE